MFPANMKYQEGSPGGERGYAWASSPKERETIPGEGERT